jgi:membrane-anchored glycerophosphoryl diester phosphodiesterase (GDPDase)
VIQSLSDSSSLSLQLALTGETIDERRQLKSISKKWKKTKKSMYKGMQNVIMGIIVIVFIVAIAICCIVCAMKSKTFRKGGKALWKGVDYID